ncbi:MAG: bis(5'-nucleosyl)-tetraphosphatase [Nanobdellota archaeon]
MKKEKSCGAIVISRSGKKIYYLLVKHNDGHWDFPKGHVEGSESEKETALREIKEETGLNVEILDSFRNKLSYYPKKDVLKYVIFFIAKSNTQKIALQKEELSNYKWHEYKDARNLLTYENAKELLDKADIFIKSRDKFSKRNSNQP